MVKKKKEEEICMTTRVTFCVIILSGTATAPGAAAPDPTATATAANNSEKGAAAHDMSSMYKLVQTINSTKFRTEPFEEFYDVFEEIGRSDNDRSRSAF